MKFCVKQILFKHIHVAAAIVKACKRVCCVSCKCNVYAWSLRYMLVNQTFNCTVLPSEYPRMPKSKLWLVDKQATKTYTTWILADDARWRLSQQHPSHANSRILPYKEEKNIRASYWCHKRHTTSKQVSTVGSQQQWHRQTRGQQGVVGYVQVHTATGCNL